MAVNQIVLPYPDFQLQEIINPEHFDLNNATVVGKINELIALVNPVTSATGSASIQSGSIAGVTGTNVFAQVSSLKALLDSANTAITSGATALATHKASADHDGRYNTKTEITTFLAGKSDTSHTHTDLHTHANKALLDTIASGHVHLHSNKALLDTITLAGHVHTHNNHSLLETIVAGNIHTHDNKAVLDKLTQGHIDTIEGSGTTNHTHSNKAVLDKIIYSGASPTIDLIGATNSASHIADSTIHVSASEKNTWNSKANASHTHLPTDIALDSSNRFVTDAEKTTWNGKASTAVVTTSTNGLMSFGDKSKLDGVATNANNYSHPATHPPSIIVQDASNRFVTDAEKTAWNGKMSASGGAVTGDFIFDETKGIVLNDLDTTKRYRLVVKSGALYLQEA